VARIVGGEVVGLLGPSQAGERDQPGREPGVEHVLVLAHGPAAARARGQVGAADAEPAATLVLAVPHRDAVAPPELPRDGPVADPLEPALVVVAAPLGDELNRPVAVPLEGGAGERRHTHEPLLGEPGLDHRAAAVAVADGVAVALHPLEQAE
jgi:hypothetical protein